MSDLKRFIKSSGIYFIGSILSRLIAFFMLPIYTKYLSPAEFGEYDLNLAYMQFFISFFFLDIYIGIMKFLLDPNLKEIENYKEKVLFSGFFIFFISAIFYFIFFYFFMQIYNIRFKVFLLLLGFVLSLQEVYSYICRAYKQNLVYVVSGCLIAILYASFSFIFLYFCNFGYEALILGAILSNISGIFFTEYNLKIFVKIKSACLDFIFFRKLLYFSLPFCLNALCYWFLAIYGRIMIANELSYEENGYYAIALKFGMVLSLITLCFKFAWQEISFSKNINKQNNSLYYSQACNEYLKFLVLSVVISLPIIKIIFPFFVDSTFYKSIIYIPFVLVGIIIFSFSEFLISIINTINKNKFLFIATMTGAITNIILLNIFIHKFKVFTVACSYIICYTIVCVFLIYIINIFFKIKINKINVFIYTFILFIQGFIMVKFSFMINFFSFIVSVLLFLFFYRKEIKAYFFKNI